MKYKNENNTSENTQIIHIKKQCESLGEFKRLLKTHLFVDHGALWHF